MDMVVSGASCKARAVSVFFSVGMLLFQFSSSGQVRDNFSEKNIIDKGMNKFQTEIAQAEIAVLNKINTDI